MASKSNTEQQSDAKPNARSSTILIHDLPDTNEIYETILWDPDEEFVFESESTDHTDYNQNTDFDILHDDDDKTIYSQTDEDEDDDESSSELSSSSYYTPLSPKSTQKTSIPQIPPLETSSSSQQNENNNAEDIKLLSPPIESKQSKQKTQSQPPMLQQSVIKNISQINKGQSLEYHILPKNKSSKHEEKDIEQNKETQSEKKTRINLKIINESNNECDNEYKQISVAQFKRTPKKSVKLPKSPNKSRKSTVKKQKRIRKQSRAAKGTIAIPEISDQIITEDDGSQIIIPVKMVYLFVRARTHHKLNNYINMNYASKSYQLDPKLVISAMDKENTVRGQCNINNGVYAFCKKNIKTQKEYKLALRTNSNDIDHANTILIFIESKLDESLQTVKKITKFNHDVCIQSIIAELNKKK